jgi:uncharacterized protein involved in outer membrane biogenesis
MAKLLKLISVLVLLLLLAAGVGLWLLSRVDLKAELEAAAAEATGLQVIVQGDLSVSLIPLLHAKLTRLAVRNRGTTIAAVGEADVAVEFIPLLRREVRVRRLALRDVNSQIERRADGQYNFSTPRRMQASQVPAGLMPVAASVAGLTLERMNVRYVDRRLGQEVSFTGCKFDGKDVQLLAGSSNELIKNLIFGARAGCDQVRTAQLAAGDVQFGMTAQRGAFELRGLQFKLLGGQGTGEIDIDLRGLLPSYRISYQLEQLRVEELLSSLSADPLAEGPLDFTARLTAQGSDLAAILRTADGEATLEGRDLKLTVGDLDQKLARYESSQNFNLVDVGAFFVAGPFGPALTKSYNFASIFRGTRGDTTVRKLVSRWRIEDGKAQAQDVAMATRANRLAVKGALDFVNESFEGVSVALLTEAGCARVEQKIGGSFGAPQIERPSVLGALSGPVRSLFGKAKRLLGMDCQVFYEGSVEP